MDGERQGNSLHDDHVVVDDVVVQLLAFAADFGTRCRRSTKPFRKRSADSLVLVPLFWLDVPDTIPLILQSDKIHWCWLIHRHGQMSV